MAPAPQKHPESQGIVPETALSGDDIVISGMSGLLPGCKNIEEFAEKLYNKVDLVKESLNRWDFSHPELPAHVGHLSDLNRFDAQFFMVNQRLANVTDAMSRKLLELTYEAVFDAGVSPVELYGKRVGVFIAITMCETENIFSYGSGTDGIVGCNRAMFANRISFYLNTVGPSVTIDCNGCGGLVALEKAQQAMRQGVCDSAIVGGSKVMMYPQSVLHHGRLLPMNKEGKTKAYDKNADGHAVSEAISVVFLQKQKDARRIYATLCHVKTEYNKLYQQKDLEYGFLREPENFEMFLQEFYKQAGVPTSLVDYVEGIGAGIPETDIAELQVIENVFSKNRKSPVLVGSVTSNVGYTETTSATTSLLKLLLAYHKGSIAPNLHYKDPLDVNGINNGSLSIVTEEEKFGRTYAALNNFSFTGVTGHALLKGFYLPKDNNKYKSVIPYLLTISGRHERAVTKILDWVKSHPVDVEEISLLNTIHKTAISNHLARGFAVLSNIPDDNPKVLKQEVKFYDDDHRPLWFIYSGMGSQWVGMGKQLLKIPVFADAIQRCDKVLSPKGVNIVDIITSSDEAIFENILHSFVGIAAIQIGITDVLKSVGILPDNIIGHSVGELGCAYADGCLTTEEMISLSYYRGLVSLETPFIRGSMAAVGLGFKQVSKLLPPEIEVACHNSTESSTLSGPAEALKQFVDKLSSQGIFAKEVACSNIAYHSKYIAEAGPSLLKYCEAVVTTPKLRSERWVSTSVPQEKWATHAKYSSAEYYVNNLLSPVFFEETSQLIPRNAVLIEIAPHCLLQAILLRSIPKDCDYIPLTRRNHSDSVVFLLEAIGKLYRKGFDIDVNALYPKVDYPVSTKTRTLSHLVEWDHSEERTLCTYEQADRHITAIFKPIVTLHDEEYRFMRGYRVGSKIVLPYAAVLVHVWDTLAMSLNKQKETLSANFRNVRFFSQPVLTDQSLLHLTIQIHRGSGRFEVIYEQGLIAEGFVTSEPHKYLDHTLNQEEPMDLNEDSIYRLLRERGYQLKGEFQSIKKSNRSFNHAKLNWAGNWVTFLDGMLQLLSLKSEPDGLTKLENIHQLTINVENQNQDQEISNYEYYYYGLPNLSRCGPIQIENVTFKTVPLTVQKKPLLRYQKFVPFFHNSDLDENTNLKVLFQIICENIDKESLKVLEINGSGNVNVLDKMDDIQYFTKTILKECDVKNLNGKVLHEVDTVILNNLMSEKMVFEAINKYLPPNTFIINITKKSGTPLPPAYYKTVASMSSQSKSNRVELAIWKKAILSSTKIITVESSSDLILLRDNLLSLAPNQKLLVFTSYPPPPGFKDLIKEIRSKVKRNRIFTAILDQMTSEHHFKKNNNFDLAFNVLKQGQWGGEYFVPEPKSMPTLNSNVRLQSLKPGDLSFVSWVETENKNNSGIPIKVHFAALNVFDARRATAEVVPSNSEGFGMDFSGTTEKGVRVMGLTEGGAASKLVNADPELLWPVPAHWTIEDAATVPLPYCLAFYCLGIRVKLFHRQSVLIHGGAGAVGQAAISIALAHGCNVFTTVSDMQKKRFLKRLFPNLPADHIGNSRDDSFMEMVLLKTNGKGCEIIISSAKGELKNSTLRCCAQSGTTIDLVQIHTRDDFQYGMFHMTKARSYTPIDFGSLFKYKNQDVLQKLHVMVSEGIKQGYVRPLSRVTYDATEASRALRLLATSRHRGRVLLNMKTLTPEVVVPKIPLSPNNFQLIFFDETDFSHQLVDKLIKHGVKKLILHSTKPSAILDFKKQIWQKRGVLINLFVTKLTNRKEVIDFLTQAKLLEGIDGIHIVSTQADTNRGQLISDIDDASRELAVQLKHFSIITTCSGYETHAKRIHNGLPSTHIQLHNLEKFEDHKDSNSLSNESALEAVISTMCRGNVSVKVYAGPSCDNNLLVEIAKITGSKITQAPDEATLEDIGVDENHSRLVCSTMERELGICLKNKQVHKMTLKELKSLEINSVPFNKEEGLDGQFNFVDTDEVMANCNFLAMKTFVQYPDQRLEEFDMDASYLCIVPGLEGHHGRFTSLCERLKVKAMVLQPGFDRPYETLDDLAERLVETMKKRLRQKNDFYLLGYEFSVAVVLRMALILENCGMTGTVYCLGGSPEEMKRTFLSQINCSTNEELQDSIIVHIYRKFNGNKLEVLMEKLKATNNWQEKIEICTLILRGQAKQSNQYIRDILESLYSRILIMKQTETNTKIYKSKIVFLRGFTEKKITEDNLRKMYSDDVVIHDLDVALAHLPNDLRVPDFLNKYLAKEVIDKYKIGNRCVAVWPDDLETNT